jgi:hypothetical protein
VESPKLRVSCAQRRGEASYRDTRKQQLEGSPIGTGLQGTKSKHRSGSRYHWFLPAGSKQMTGMATAPWLTLDKSAIVHR